MSTFLTVEGLRAAAYGIDIPAGVAVDAALQGLIDKAEARLVASIPSIPDRVAAGTLSVDLVKGVVEDMALRVVSNPRGLRSVSIDDYSETLDVGAGSSSGLYLSAAERSLLEIASRARPAFGSIRVGANGWWLNHG